MDSEINIEAMVEVLQVELQEVQWLAKHARDSLRKAAAALRVVKLEDEIKAIQKVA